MAVFTVVTDDEVQALLKEYAIGGLTRLTGISAGIENTNYFLDTTSGHFVLTIFEVLTADQLPFYVELMHALGSQQVPVPMPQTRTDGQRISTLHDKPAIIVSKLPGQWVKQPSPQHCRLAAKTMAKAHLAAKDFVIKQPNLRGLPWWQATAPLLSPYISKPQSSLLEQALGEQVALAASGALAALAQGPAHCDYFRDNVLFTGTDLEPVMGGVIDFYFAGCDYWLFDLCVAINDWCINQATGELVPEHVQAWLEAYQSIRPLTEQERELWPQMLRAAALRFWISRLYDYHRPRPAQTLTPHDPTHFERILTIRYERPAPPIPEVN
jgi:homoserine kinase type II